MQVIDIFGDNRFDKHTKFREASRGIVINNNQILLSYEVNRNQWFIPGGGKENGESNLECCIREVKEETGYLVSAENEYLIINEYYERYPKLIRPFTKENGGGDWGARNYGLSKVTTD